MLLKQATDIAIEICKQLQPHCYNINIAGSVRRKKPDVGDIEIVCRPIRQATGQATMFDVPAEVAVVKKFEDTVNSLGEILMGNANGRQMKILLPEDIKLDLFIPQDNDYFRIYAIRTGSSQYSNLVIAHAWKKKGWCGTDQGLRRIEDCVQAGEHHWKLINLNGMKPPLWTSEADFFEWLGVSYLNPQLREIYSTSAYKQHKNLIKS